MPSGWWLSVVRHIEHACGGSPAVVLAHYPRQVAWTALLAWQLRFIASRAFRRGRDGRLRRFALVHPNGQVEHAMQLFGDGEDAVRMPPWFGFDALCVDIVHGEGGRKCKEMTLKATDEAAQEVPYYPWERRELPNAGTAVVTHLAHGRVVAWGVVPWSRPACPTASLVLGALPAFDLVFGPLGMYVTVRSAAPRTTKKRSSPETLRDEHPSKRPKSAAKTGKPAKI